MLPAPSNVTGSNTLKHKHLFRKPRVLNQFNTPFHLPHRPDIVAMELSRHTDEPWVAPPDRRRDARSKPILDEQTKLRPVVVQPVQVEQPLADQVVGRSALVFDHYWRAIAVNLECVDASLMPDTNGILRRDQMHVEQGEEMPLHQCLERFLGRLGTFAQFSDGVAAAAHAKEPEGASCAGPADGMGSAGGHKFILGIRILLDKRRAWCRQPYASGPIHRCERADVGRIAATNSFKVESWSDEAGEYLYVRKAQ